MASATMRVLIADDERLARRGLRQLLDEEPDLVIVAECETGEQTLSMLRAQAIDILFLDVRMPVGDGFDVLAAVASTARPVVVFVTAFAQHARDAFDARALDYVLKPLERDRVRESVTRAREQVRLRRLSRYDEQLDTLLPRHTAPPAATSVTRFPQDVPINQLRVGPSRRIAVPSRSGVRLLAEEDVDWIQALGYYARFRIGGEGLLIRESLDALQARLDPSRFVRIHRSAIVNLDRIASIRGYTYGRAIVVLSDGTKLILSRSRRAAVGAIIGWPITHHR